MKKINIKKIIKEIFIFAIALFIVSNILSYFNAPKLSSNKLPYFSATTINKKLFSSQNKHKKPLLIHFWATWCPICKIENSSISSLSSKFDVITIAESSGSNQKIRKFLKQHHLKFRVINDKNGLIASLFKVKAFPSSFIYSPNNKLKFIDVGYSSYLGMYARLLYAGITKF